MGNQNEIVIELRTKIDTVISMYEKIKVDYKQILQENELLTKEVLNKKKEIKEFEEKYNRLKLSKTILASSDHSHEAKIKINSIVREIDKCIAQLNR